MEKPTVIIREVKAPSMAGAIRRKCLDCCGGAAKDVKACDLVYCPLFPYRFGANPAAAIKRLEKCYQVKIVKTGREVTERKRASPHMGVNGSHEEACKNSYK